MEEEDTHSIHSELRYLTLELMKLSYSQNKSFEEIAEEFVRNVYKLKTMIIEKSGKKWKKK